MTRAGAKTYVYPLIGQTQGEVDAVVLPVDGVDLPLVGYTAAYGRRIGDLELYAMAAAPVGHIYRTVGFRVDLGGRGFNGPPSTLDDMDTAAILYADRPSATIEDHLRNAGLHINGYTLDQAISAEPRIIDRIAQSRQYEGIRCVVWNASVGGKLVKVITSISDDYIVDVQCLALPDLHVRIPSMQQLARALEHSASAAARRPRPVRS